VGREERRSIPSPAKIDEHIQEGAADVCTLRIVASEQIQESREILRIGLVAKASKVLGRGRSDPIVGTKKALEQHLERNGHARRDLYSYFPPGKGSPNDI
jgi:hypothetical protein